MVFDREFNFLNGGYEPLTTNARETGDTLLLPEGVGHDTLAFKDGEIKITEPGFVYIYFSNENESRVEVFFDDFEVTHVKSPVVQVDDYYPFGLTFNSSHRENTLDQKYKFQGQEHISDLSLGWDSFKWRNHQPDIGRFFNIDALADKYVYNSPYAFSENHVVAHVELEGLEKVSIQQSLGNNYKFYNAYNIQRQTTAGTQFSRNFSKQKKYNLLYITLPKNSFVEGFTTKFSNLSEYKKSKETDGTFANLSIKEVEQAMGDKMLMIIALNEGRLNADESGKEGAATLNHEEDAHANRMITNKSNVAADAYTDHEYYFGESKWYSPETQDIESEEKYKNTRAKRQLNQIIKIINQQINEREKRDKKTAEFENTRKTQ